MESETVTVTEAARLLGTSKEKVARLVKEGVLTARPSIIDRRRRLIPRAEVERILSEERGPASTPPADRAPLPKTLGIYTGPVKVHSDEVEEYLHKHWHPS